LLEAILGNNQKALDRYQDALPILQTAGDRYWEAIVILNTGGVYYRLGDQDKALSYLEQARRILHEINNPSDEAGALSVIGWIHHERGEYQVALDYLKHVLSVTQAVEDKKYQSNALRKIGAVYRSLGDKRSALTYYQKALALHRTAGERQGEASAYREMGQLYHELNQRGAALSCYQKALALNRIGGDRFAQSQTLFSLATVERDLGRIEKSRSHIEEASGLVEILRTEVASPNLRATYFASIRRFFEFHIDLLMRQNQRNPAKKLSADALNVSEGARSRSLLELLSEARTNIRQGADQKLIERETELRKQIEEQVRRKTLLIDAKAPENEWAIITNQIALLSAERDRVEAQIRSQNPLYSSLAKTQPANLEQIQELLDQDTILLEYALGSERSYLWAVSRDGLKSFELPNRAIIEKVAVEVYKLLTTPHLDQQTAEQVEAKYWRKASELSRMILGKVDGQLGRKRLLIVADGVLQYIPFQALPESGLIRSAESQPLMINHEIVNLPSASTLAVLRRERAQREHWPKTIAVFADPVFREDDMRLISAAKTKAEQQLALNHPTSNTRSSSILTALGQVRVGRDYPRLHSTQSEANVIAEVTKSEERILWTGFDATLANAMSPELSKYRIIHFATHGDLDTENPELSAIVLSFFNSRRQKQDGYLRLQDIYNLHLPADLIVLSACETALGKEIKGEGLIGLTRGFMYAGAARVMSSLWKVEDRSTAELMRYFYTYLLKDKMSPAAALRRAQIEVRKQREWRLPYHWAGFVLQGESR
jgi:CHAT domain-containing protein